MKRITGILIGLILCVALSAQNTYKYQIFANGGLSIGTGGTKIAKGIVSNNYLWFIGASDTLAIGTPTENQLDASDYFVKLLTDSVAISTTGRTLLSTDAHKVVYCTGTGGEPMEITIPQNTFTAGTTINFVQTGTKLIKFIAGSGVTLNAFPADSVHSDGKNAIVGLLFRTANKVQLYGNIGN